MAINNGFLTTFFLESLARCNDEDAATKFVHKMILTQSPETWKEYFTLLDKYATVSNYNFCISNLMNHLRLLLFFWNKDDPEYNTYVSEFNKMMKTFEGKYNFEGGGLPELNLNK